MEINSSYNPDHLPTEEIAGSVEIQDLIIKHYADVKEILQRSIVRSEEYDRRTLEEIEVDEYMYRIGRAARRQERYKDIPVEKRPAGERYKVAVVKTQEVENGPAVDKVAVILGYTPTITDSTQWMLSQNQGFTLPPDTAELLRFYAHPSLKQKGYGKKLWENIHNEMKNVGINSCCLVNSDRYESSRPFYERQGYWTVTRGFYVIGDPGEPLARYPASFMFQSFNSHERVDRVANVLF